MLKVLDLFSGIGGFSLGLHRAGMETVAFCEIEPYPQAVLKKNFPGVPIYDDVRTITAERLRADGIDTVDLVCGGFPCQPFSQCGSRKGTADHRHLWPEMLRVVQECRPRWVIGENVARFAKVALEEVCVDLETSGYEVWSFIIPAIGVGAPHRRRRTWIVAESQHTNTDSIGLHRAQINEQRNAEFCNEQISIVGSVVQSEIWSRIDSRVFGVADGIPNRVDRLKCLGNAVVPQIPEIIGRAIMAADARVI